MIRFLEAADYIDLRDIEQLTANRRLSKQEFMKNGIEFGVYVQNQHGLLVPTDDVIKHSEMRYGLRVACPEHLLTLKAKAMENRMGSSKGDKNEDDIVRVLLLDTNLTEEKLYYLSGELITIIEKAVQGDAPNRLADGNKHISKQLRIKAQTNLDIIKQLSKNTHEENSISKPSCG